MKTIRNILVATDFSNDAYAALHYVTRLLASQTCTFHLFNAYEETTPLESGKTKPIGGRSRLAQLADRSHERLTETRHRIQRDDPNPIHRFETLSKKGSLIRTITDTIDGLPIDLIVMGNKGETGAKEIFLGGNTVRVANSATSCPTLAIPRQIDFRPPRELAFITDLKKGCGSETLGPLRFLASLSQASIRVMHIDEETIPSAVQESNRSSLEAQLKDVPHSFHQRLGYSDKAEVIHAFLDQFGIDLFAMVKSDHGFFGRLLHEPVIQDISLYTDIPFLILSERN